MKRFPHLGHAAALGVFLLGGCAGQVGLRPSATSSFDSAGSPIDAELAPAAPAEVAADLPAARPQLIRRANLQLRVESVEDAQDSVEAIVLQRGGDILGLQASRPEPGARRSISLSLRVPQARLDRTLEELAALGTVLSQQITAEDVTNQLVDFDARLKNLQRTEQTLLEIMERSGKVADVLEVARELANVRQSIEQIDASLTNLRNQVAFSSIDVYVIEARVTTPQVSRPAIEQLRSAWQQSVRSLGSFSIGFLRLLIWLLVFSPYLLSFGIALILVYRYRRSSKRTQATIAVTQETQAREVINNNDEK